MVPQLPRILAFDTSSSITAVAVCEGPRVLAADHTIGDARHAELIFPKLRQCLAQAGLTLQEIALIAVGVGPGSFTGLRVGVATAKGLGLALHKPVLPVSSLEALASGAVAHGACAGPWIAACVDAYKGELFAALYRVNGQDLVEVLAPFHAAPLRVVEQLAAASGAEPVALVGAGVSRYPELLAALPERMQPVSAQIAATPTADAVAALAYAAHTRGEQVDLAGVLPVYLRDCDAQLPKQPLRL